MNEDKILVDKKLIESICKYCEDQAIYDKIGFKYNDFYYRLKELLR